jgi:glycogen(starch) synthase
MRILVVSEDIPYPNMGGLAKHALNLSRALVRAGHQVDILGGDQNPIEVAGNEGKFGGRFFGELTGHLAGWREISLGTIMPLKRTWKARRFARTILRHAADYDVIHYHGHIPNVARYIPPEINFVQTRHDQGSDCVINSRFRNDAICNSTSPTECARCMTENPNAIQRAVSTIAVVKFRREVIAGFRRHKTVFVSDMLQRNLSRTAGLGPWGLTIHNFIDLGALQRARESADAKHGEGEVHVFIAGKLSPSKGIEPFLRTLLPHLPANMHVAIAGDGAAEARLRAEFESPQIRFLGWCAPEMTLKLSAEAHAIVVPSMWEDPCPSTIFEGLLLGKPTFALARGGTPELKKYAASPKQLRLHDYMESLVQDLVACSPDLHDLHFAPGAPGLGGADRAVEKLLEVYRLPPGLTLAL